MNNPEHRLQAECVIEFSRLYPKQRGRLIGYFAETKDPREGGIKTSLGLVKGVSDILYFKSYDCVIGIEVKAKGTSHSVRHLIEQCEWLINIPSKGYFCDTKEMFFDIVGGKSGIEPSVILERLKNVKTKTVRWDEISKL